KLNEEIIKRLPIPEKGNRITYFPAAVLQGTQVPRGFGVRVTASGAKSFIMNYRIKREEYRYTIGPYPDWSALQAVREARTLRQRIDRGENPLDERAAPPEVKTVAVVLDEFMTRYGRNQRRASEYQREFDRPIKPAISNGAL